MEAIMEKAKIINIGETEDTIDYTSLIPQSVFNGCVFGDDVIDDIEENLPTQQGMDDLPESLFNALLEQLLAKRQIRNAMLITLHANFGLRNCDVCKLRFLSVLKKDGSFRHRISGTEKKTSKIRNLYLNDAVKIAIATYLNQHPEKNLFDFMIVSEGRVKKYQTDYFEGNDGETYEYTTQTPLSRIQEERAIKDTLLEMGVKLKNDSRCTDGEAKYNTHSLRKLYAEKFTEVGCQLKEKGTIHIDTQIYSLLQLDLNHSSTMITQRYNRSFERCKEKICMNMNLGLQIWKNYLKENQQ